MTSKYNTMRKPSMFTAVELEAKNVDEERATPNPAAWPVNITDSLAQSSRGAWVAFGLAIAVSIFLIVIACVPVVVVSLGAPWSTFTTIWLALRTTLGIAITGFITGQILKLWLYKICTPQPSREKAATAASLGRLLTGLGEMKDRLKFWEATLSVVAAALMQTAFVTALLFVPVYETQPWSMTTGLKNTFAADCIDYSLHPKTLLLTWPLNSTNHITATLSPPGLDGEICPWYLTPSIFGPSEQALGYAYSVDGVPVQSSAVGVPFRLGDGIGPFESTFGTYQKSLTPLSRIADTDTPFVLQASACMPVLTSTPAQCTVSGPVTIDSKTGNYTFGDHNCNVTRPIGQSVTSGSPAGNNSTWTDWTVCIGDRPVGSLNLAVAASYRNAEAFAAMLAGNTTTVASIETISINCEIDIEPTIGFRQVYYEPTSGIGTDNVNYAVVGTSEACVPQTPAGQPLDRALFVNNYSLAIGASGTGAFSTEFRAEGGFPSLLTQMYRARVGEPRNFANSRTPVDDLIGIVVGATLGAYWGMTVPAQLPDQGYASQVKIVSTRLGHANYVPVVFAIPFLLAAARIFVLLRQKGRLSSASGRGPAREIEYRPL